jgi:aspartyl-tRNA(Asn)/glutamyl-tRNA(Gln) amidotransferase subunit A
MNEPGDLELIEETASPEEWRTLSAFGGRVGELVASVDEATDTASPDALVELGAERTAAVEVGPSAVPPDHLLTVAECRDALMTGAMSCEELVSELLARAAKHTDLGVYIATNPESTLAAARASDRRRARREPLGDLDGIPVSLKDLLTTEDFPTTAQSRVPDPVGQSTTDAVAVARLRDAGTVIIGKTTLMEYACGMDDEATGFPLPRNPWDRDRWPGGSSSGAGAGLAASLFPAAIGSDTGGSIRVPAAYCGVTGFKPSHGLVPAQGCVPLSWSMDHVGPLARTAEDCELVLRVLTAGPPPGATDLGSLRVAYLDDSLDHLADEDDDVRARIDDAIAVIGSTVKSVHSARLPLAPSLFAAGSLVINAESYVWHRRRLMESWSAYGSPARIRLAYGAFVPQESYGTALRYLHTMRARLTTDRLGADLIALPTSDRVAPLRSDLNQPTLEAELSHPSLAGGSPRPMPHGRTPLFNIPWSTLGLPVASIPVGLSKDGLPISMQLVGRAREDHVVLAVARRFQELTDFHHAEPPGFTGGI